jgi:hypothetical protein
MTPIDEMTAAERAWVLFKKINELHNLLWDCYYEEFLRFQQQLKKRRIDGQDTLPF